MHSDRVGERGTLGALTSIGLRVSRARLRRVVKEQDPIGTNSRWRTHLKRREYFFPFVNSLWHIDGHHKLKHWKVVIHGAIDGSSRLVTYLRLYERPPTSRSTPLPLFLSRQSTSAAGRKGSVAIIVERAWECCASCRLSVVSRGRCE